MMNITCIHEREEESRVSSILTPLEETCGLKSEELEDHRFKNLGREGEETSEEENKNTVKDTKCGENTVAQLIAPYFFGVSVRGESHLRTHMPCQDACGCRILHNKYGIVAISDGLGSAKKSDIGSKTAVQGAIDKAIGIIDTLEQEKLDSFNSTTDRVDLSWIATAAAHHAREMIEMKASEERCELQDLACTLIVVIHRGDMVATAHIGDGSVVALFGEDTKIISEPEPSEFVNSVYPITNKEWKKHLRTSETFSGVDAVASFTDGCEIAFLRRESDGIKPVQKFFMTLFTVAKRIQSIEKGEMTIKQVLLSKPMVQTSDDDRTLFMSVLR